jgi:hypothetical protein
MAITAAGQSASSLEYYARINAEKETIKNQAAGLESAAQEVKTRLETFRRDGLFAYLYDNNKNSSAFRDFSLNALRSLVKSYNTQRKQWALPPTQRTKATPARQGQSPSQGPGAKCSAT